MKDTHPLVTRLACHKPNRHPDAYRELKDMELPLVGGRGRQGELDYAPKP